MARENSWATGTNPEVNSCMRGICPEPRLKDTTARGRGRLERLRLRGQIDALLASDPKPDLVLVTSVDNDIRCEGTDPQTTTRLAPSSLTRCAHSPTALRKRAAQARRVDVAALQSPGSWDR